MAALSTNEDSSSYGLWNRRMCTLSSIRSYELGKLLRREKISENNKLFSLLIIGTNQLNATLYRIIRDILTLWFGAALIEFWENEGRQQMISSSVLRQKDRLILPHFTSDFLITSIASWQCFFCNADMLRGPCLAFPEFMSFMTAKQRHISYLRLLALSWELSERFEPLQSVILGPRYPWGFRSFRSSRQQVRT